jgi:multidrug efflux pump
MMALYVLLCGGDGAGDVETAGQLPADGGPGRNHGPVHPARRGNGGAYRRGEPPGPDWFLNKEKANTDVIFTVDGFSFSGSGQNAGMAFVSLKNWSERKGTENTAPLPCVPQELSTIRDATIFAMTPPSVDGLGQSNGFTFELMAAGNTDRETLLKMRNQLIGEANQDSDLHAVRANDLPQMPQLQVDIDNNKAVSLGLPSAM